MLAVMDSQVTSGGRRGRGKRAGITLAQIVTSARSMGARAVTMQAVADDLGVDRKAINHHVRDLASLLRLAALDAFAEGSDGYSISADATWQDAVRAYAHALVEGMIAAADFSEHLRPDAALITKFVAPTEVLVGRLYDAGFTDEETVRTLAMLSNLCIAHGRDVVYVTGGGAPPRPAMLREGLAAVPPETYPNLARLAAAGIDTYDRTQLDLSIETLIAGTQALRPAING